MATSCRRGCLRRDTLRTYQKSTKVSRIITLESNSSDTVGMLGMPLGLTFPCLRLHCLHLRLSASIFNVLALSHVHSGPRNSCVCSSQSLSPIFRSRLKPTIRRIGMIRHWSTHHKMGHIKLTVRAFDVWTSSCVTLGLPSCVTLGLQLGIAVPRNRFGILERQPEPAALDSFSLTLDSCMSLARRLNLVLPKGRCPSVGLTVRALSSQFNDCTFRPFRQTSEQFMPYVMSNNTKRLTKQTREVLWAHRTPL
jgi:hypothetical protein